MKKIGLLLVMSIWGVAASAQTAFTIDGTIRGKNNGFLYLSYTDQEGKYQLDSALVVNNAFSFTGKIKELSNAYIRSSLKSNNIDDPNSVSFFIEPTAMKLTLVSDDFKNFQLSGSRTEDDNKALAQLKAPIRAEMKPFTDAYNKANESYMQAMKDKLPQAEQDVLKKKAGDIRDQFDPFKERLDQLDYTFIIKNPDSYLSGFLMIFKVSRLPLDSVLMFYNQLTPKVQQSGYGKQVAAEIVKLQKGAPGAIATIFSATDINGKSLSLADFKGKYVLLDFWASWCTPCREGNPHLKKLYAQYQGKGFEIIGISDDDSKPEAWKNAVKQDEIGIWKHVLRGLKQTKEGFDRSNDISDNFGIHSLPTKILIDKDGKIIGRYGGGGESDEAMDKKLAAIFGKS